MKFFDFMKEILPLLSTILSFVTVSFAAFWLSRKTAKFDVELNQVKLDVQRRWFDREIEILHEKLYRDSEKIGELNHLVIDSVRSMASVPDDNSEKFTSNSFLKSMGIDGSKIVVDPEFVFVLTPLNTEQKKVYDIIRDTCQRYGLKVMRGDEKKIDGPILPFIVKQIASSNLVIANLNGRNPNVFYELGIAQALGKRAILVIKYYDDIPFDMKDQQIVIYKDIRNLAYELEYAIAKSALAKDD